MPIRQHIPSQHLTSQHSAAAPRSTGAVQDKQTGHSMRRNVLGNAFVAGPCWGSPVAIWGNDPRNCWYWSLHCRAKPRCFSSGKVQWSFWDGTCRKRVSVVISMLHALLVPRRGYRRYPPWRTPWHIPRQLGRPSSLQWCLPEFYRVLALWCIWLTWSSFRNWVLKMQIWKSSWLHSWCGQICHINCVLQCFASLQPACGRGFKFLDTLHAHTYIAYGQ